MRSRARRSALTAFESARCAVSAMSAASSLRVAGVSLTRSNRTVSATSAASPSRRTSSMIAAAARSTSSATPRRASAKAAKRAAKSRSRLSSLSGMAGRLHRVAETLDPGADLVGARLERGPVDDEARGDVGDALDLDQAVGLERPAGRYLLNDATAQVESRLQRHRAGELAAPGLRAARGEMAARDLGVLGGDAHMAPARRTVARDHLAGLGHRKGAAPDLEAEGRVDLG